MEIDVWFCNYEDKTFFVTANHDEPPMRRPLPIRPDLGVKGALRMLSKGRKIAQVGILPPEMIGLDIEV